MLCSVADTTITIGTFPLILFDRKSLALVLCRHVVNRSRRIITTQTLNPEAQTLNPKVFQVCRSILLVATCLRTQQGLATGSEGTPWSRTWMELRTVRIWDIAVHGSGCANL